MTTPPLVTYSLSDSIATITLDDGKANVMSEPMQQAIGAALDRAEADQAVVLLTGRERIFSGGYDLAMFRRTPHEVARTVGQGGELVRRILGLSRPVVVACNGHAIAQASFILLAADVRIGAAGPFKIGLNEVAIGLTIPHYGVELARFRLSPAWFNHATLTGTLYDPGEALVAGFLDQVVEHEQLAPAAREQAIQLTKIDARAHAATKQRVRRHVLAALREGIDNELRVAEISVNSP
jgi:enoyl-CoA hydratase